MLDATALSTLIYTAWTGNASIGFSNPLTQAQQAIVKAMADGIAASVVQHLKSAAVVTTSDAQGGSNTGTIS